MPASSDANHSAAPAAHRDANASAAADAALVRMRAVARTRWRLAGALTAVMIAVYFGFLSLVAWSPTLIGRLLAPGLSLGVLLGALVIVCAWLLTWVYVRWANAVYDPMVAEQRAALRAAADKSAELLTTSEQHAELHATRDTR